MGISRVLTHKQINFWFRLNQPNFRLILNQSENGKYNLIPVNLTRIRSWFIQVLFTSGTYIIYVYIYIHMCIYTSVITLFTSSASVNVSGLNSTWLSSWLCCLYKRCYSHKVYLWRHKVVFIINKWGHYHGWGKISFYRLIKRLVSIVID